METLTRNDLKIPVAIAELQRSFVVRVYGWMTLGLAVTAAASLFTLAQPNLFHALLESPLLLWGLLIIELVLVLVLSAKIGSLGVTTTRIAFLGYAALTGVSLTPLVLTYTASSLFRVFVITAGLFGAMCLYGHITRRDLTGWASYLFMFLVGLVLASVANLGAQRRVMDWLLGLAGVVVFVGLSAYDAQAVRRLGATLDEPGKWCRRQPSSAR